VTAAAPAFVFLAAGISQGRKRVELPTARFLKGQMESSEHAIN
jgi:hypothetical protein